LGVRSAAVALNLDFIPTAWERYDLCIPEAHLNHPGVQALLELLENDAFKQTLGARPGYDTRETGRRRQP
jgi:putative molybdopterin biosynthesis protein